MAEDHYHILEGNSSAKDEMDAVFAPWPEAKSKLPGTSVTHIPGSRYEMLPIEDGDDADDDDADDDEEKDEAKPKAKEPKPKAKPQATAQPEAAAKPTAKPPSKPSSEPVYDVAPASDENKLPLLPHSFSLKEKIGDKPADATTKEAYHKSSLRIDGSKKFATEGFTPRSWVSETVLNGFDHLVAAGIPLSCDAFEGSSFLTRDQVYINVNADDDTARAQMTATAVALMRLYLL